MPLERSVKTGQRKVKMFGYRTKAGTNSLSISSSNIDIATDYFTSVGHGLVTQDRILFTEDAAPTALTLGASEVTNATNSFAETDHGFVDGEAILVTEDNTLPSGLSTATTYYAIVVDADNFQLATNYANAIAGTPQALADDGTGDNSYDAVPAPAGLTSATQYWVIKIDDDNFQLATTYANALAGTDIDITGIGAGSNTYANVEEFYACMDSESDGSKLQATAVGTYRVDFPEVYVLQPLIFANSLEADKAVSIDTIDEEYCIIKINDIDETANLSDGTFNILIVGQLTDALY